MATSLIVPRNRSSLARICHFRFVDFGCKSDRDHLFYVLHCREVYTRVHVQNRIIRRKTATDINSQIRKFIYTNRWIDIFVHLYAYRIHKHLVCPYFLSNVKTKVSIFVVITKSISSTPFLLD